MTSISPTAEPAALPAAPSIPEWRRVITRYQGADATRALLQLGTTIGLLALALWVAYAALDVSVWLTLALTLPAGGLLVRTFILMHDCAHGSFLPWRRVNDAVGFWTGVVTLTPYAQWRRDHALHHASSGDLDRRGHGDVPTLTVREYLGRSARGRFAYRVVRHPLSLLMVGPLYLMVSQRMRPRSTATGAREQVSIWSTNAAIVLLAALAWWAFGWRAVALVYFPAMYVAAMAGVWLFYVQHQFEDAYWESHDEWDYATAALRGSSHLRLPALLQWFSGSIGLHHIHHLSPRIPNHRLQRCHDENPLFQTAPVVTMRSGMAALRLALWDEEQRRLVRFEDVR